MDKDYNVKVGDFGISTVLDNQRMLTGNMGTVGNTFKASLHLSCPNH